MGRIMTAIGFSLIWLLGCTGTDSEPIPWLAPDVDLGSPRATGTGLSLADDASVWNAVDQIIPGMFWALPGHDIALTVFNTMLEDEGITDAGTCPYTTATGPTLTWVTNCRSQDGYTFSGTVDRTDGSTDGRDWRQWEFDLDVSPDTDFPDLDRVSLHGELVVTSGNGDDALLSALQVNMLVGVEGYLEAVNGTQTQQEMWQDWSLTARYEQHEASNGVQMLMEGSADLGSHGGLDFLSTDLLLPDTCPNEPDGTLTINGDASIVFDGSNGCDRCSTLEIDGEQRTICPQ